MSRTFSILLLLAFLAFPATAQTAYSPNQSGLGFGGTVSASGNEIVVGTASLGWPRGDEPAGAAYVFRKGTDGSWTEIATLRASDGRIGDDFGKTVFMKGNTIVVGAPGVKAAYVFEKEANGNWKDAGKLAPKQLQEGYEFGGAYARAGNRTGNIAIAGAQVIVTSYNSTSKMGLAHVFGRKGGQWVETDVFSAFTAKEGDGYAMTIAANDANVFVAAPGSNDGKGQVFVFMDHGQWVQMGSLTVSAEGSSSLGASMAVSEGKVYVGAPNYMTKGAVLIYEMQPTGLYGQVGIIEAPVAAEGEPRIVGFGIGVAASGQNILISARGAAFAYRIGTDGYVKIEAPDQRSNPGFGSGIAVSGDISVIGSASADAEAGIATVFERSNSGNWNVTGTLASKIVRLESHAGDKIECKDGKSREFSCDNVDLVSFMNVDDLSTERGVGMTDIWGWEDPETGKEWVIIGRTEGVSFVDISDPSHPVWVGEMLKTATSPGSTWRDVKVYKNHAFVVADGAEAHGLQIFDLTQLRDAKPEDMPITYPETARYMGTNSTHNIVINEETGFAYAVGNRSGGETCGGQLHIINIQDPANPTFAGCFSNENASGAHDSQCVIYHGDDVDYKGHEICLTSSGNMFVIADVTDKSNTITLAATSYPNQAYTHQGWLTDDHNYFYMNDELDELNGLVDKTRTLIWDTRDLEDPILMKEFLHDNAASDHNLYVRGNYMYQSNYQAGIRILDISDPENPVAIGHFDTVPFGEDEAGFGGSWSNYPYFKSGIIAVSSRGEGLFLIRKKEVDI
ncbi:MAG: choice-of-anchor B family protein [Bacteroidetes bacterium]|nr:choice-of-anchor B family protein [Bacteroidota bacterium]